MKKDGRSLDRKAQEKIRLIAVRRVREGEPAAKVIEEYGLNRTTIYKWLSTAQRRGVGVKALRSTKATGRPPSLTPVQERQVFRWANGRCPRQFGLDFDLWTRAVVSELIVRKLGKKLSVTTVGELLAKFFLTPQKHSRRAYPRNTEVAERWRCETYPAIARRAKVQGAEVLFWNESSIPGDTVHAETGGVCGKTRVLRRSGQRQSISAASAVNASGAFWFRTYRGAMNAKLFIQLLTQMMKCRKKPVHLMVDNLPAHKSTCVKQFIASTNGRLQLHFLPR